VNDNLQKAGVAVIAALVTYAAKGLSLEGRIDAIEKSVLRIEARVYQTPPVATAPAVR
jgi:hypothetical protein